MAVVPRHPARPPSLPQWLEERLRSLRKVSRRDESGLLREVLVLPPNLVLDQSQRREIENYVADLSAADRMTPDNDQQYFLVTLTAVSKLIMALGGKKSGDLAGEAKGEAYMMALSDVPCWTVEDVMRKWYRGEFDQGYDYSFPPPPAVLRKHARDEQYMHRYNRDRLSGLLLA